MSAESAAVLNVAEDHLDWYPSMEEYAADKGRIYERVQRACVYNVADPATERLVGEADVVEGARAIGFTLGMPGVGMLGMVEDILADRAFIEERRLQRRRAVHDRRPRLLRRPTTSPNALAAAALARAHGVSQAAVRDGLRGLPPRRPPDRGRRRGRRRHLGRRLQGDQPARRPVLAAGLRPGGLGRRRAGQGRPLRRPGAAVRDRLRGVVLLGQDRDVIAVRPCRHAPDVPVIEIGDDETGRRGRSTEPS